VVPGPLAWKRVRAGVGSLLLAAGLMLGSSASASAHVGEITEYPIPITTTPYGVTTGPDGKIWIIDSGNHVGGTFIGRMATSGAISESDLVQLPSSALGEAATTGPDGNMWVAQDNQIDKVPVGMSKTSEITPYPLGSSTKGFGSIASGPDGRMWFGWNEEVGAITTAGAIEGYATSSTSSISGVTVGPDGKLWFSESGSTIARMDTSGKIGAGNEFPLSGYSGIEDLARGSDGNMWFTTASPAAVGRITTAGAITMFPTPTASSLPFGIEAGPDGRMWFVEENGNNIASIPTSATSSTEIVEYPIPTKSAGAIYITAGPDSRMWFGESSGRIGAITTNVTSVSPMTTPTSTTSTTTGSSTQSPSPPFGPLPPLPNVPVPVGCVANKLILTDVFPWGGHTQVLGVAPASAVGKRVAIVSSWNGKTVVQATVQADLSFKATVTLPPRALRFTNRALYRAKLGRVSSGALKFARRMYTTAITAAGRTITFAGSVTPPLAKKILPVTVRASASCSGIANGTVVATVKLSRSGTYSTAVRLPASLQGAPAVYLQAETRVLQNSHSKKTFRTFTLVRGVRLSP